MPIAAAELPHGRDIAAALLILRECLHHLGFDRVDAVPDCAAACCGAPAKPYFN